MSSPSRIKSVFDYVRHKLERISSDPEWELFSGFSHSVKDFIKLEKSEDDWEDILLDFDCQRTHQERIDFLLNDTVSLDLISFLVQEVLDDREPTSKSWVKAKELREKGDERFSQGLYNTALELYSEALSYAPSPSKDSSQNIEYSLTCASRSSALFGLQRYQECIEDIEEALENGYPSECRQALITTKIVCHRALDQTEQLDQLVKQLEIDDNKPHTKNHDLLTNALTQNVIKPLTEGRRALVTNLAEPHPSLRGASNCLNVEQSKEKGRYIVATRDIDPSEVLFSERPFSWWLRPSMYSEFCFHCMKWLSHCPVPCEYCTVARFCSKSCRHEAWLSYHEKECTLIDVLKSFGTGHLALRMVMTAGTESAIESFKSMSTRRGKNQSTYERVLCLKDNTEHRELDSLFAYSCGAVLITILAKRFEILPANLCSTDFGAIILRHLLQLRSNVSSVVIDDCDPASGCQRLSTPQKSIGYAVYPSIALLNHSCGIVTYSLFVGNQQIVKSVDTIKKGEEVTLNYGVFYNKSTKKERSSFLQQQYFFECKCKFCESGQEYIGNALRCPRCKGHMFVNIDGTTNCLRCGPKRNGLRELRSDHSKLRRSLLQASEFYEVGDYRKSLDTLSGALQEALVVLWPKNELIAEIHAKIGRCCGAILDFESSLTHWNESFNVIKELHGEENYEAVSCLINMAMLSIQLSKHQRKVKSVYENAVKAKRYFNEASRICNKLIGKEYFLLSARQDALKDLELIPEFQKF